MEQSLDLSWKESDINSNKFIPFNQSNPEDIVMRSDRRNAKKKKYPPQRKYRHLFNINHILENIIFLLEQ